MGEITGDRSVRRHKHPLPHWARQTFKTEAIGEKAAFEEPVLARKAALAAMPESDPNHQVRLPLVGGPMDGGAFRVPTMLMRRGPAAPTFEIPIPADAAPLYLPQSVHRPAARAVYRLDKAHRLLRFERVVTL